MKADSGIQKNSHADIERMTVLNTLCDRVHSLKDEASTVQFVLDSLTGASEPAWKRALFLKLFHAEGKLRVLPVQDAGSLSRAGEMNLDWDNSSVQALLANQTLARLERRDSSWIPEKIWGALDTDVLYFFPLADPAYTWGALLLVQAGDTDVTDLTGTQRFLFHSGTALAHLGILEKTESRFAELAMVQQLSKNLSLAAEYEDTIQLISRLAAQALNAEGSLLWLVGKDSGLRLVASFGKGAGLARKGVKSKLVDVVKWAQTDGGPLVVSQVSEDVRFSDLASHIKSFVVAPLQVHGEPLGALVVLDRIRYSPGDKGQFVEDDLSLAETLANAVSISIATGKLARHTQDIQTKLKDAEARLQRYEQLSALGELSAKAAHETKNVLASIGGFAKKISKGSPERDPKREWAAIILKEVLRLERMVGEQLEFAKLAQPRYGFVSINEIIDESLRLFSEQVDKENVTITKSLAGNLPKLVLDAERIKQVMLNILRNAQEAIGDKGGRIVVGSKLRSKSVEIEIVNDGDPIPGQLLSHLFVPFASTKSHGSGLGLAIAHQIIKEHGGEINVRSDSDSGTAFTISIPLRGNEDRRMRVGDRRRRASDRRRTT
jgi:signal transduction histidine kinase